MAILSIRCSEEIKNRFYKIAWKMKVKGIPFPKVLLEMIKAYEKEQASK